MSAAFWLGQAMLAAVAAFATPIARAEKFDLATATIGDMNRAFDAGALTSERLTSLYLARIRAFDKNGPEINCVISLSPDALAQARRLDKERKEFGPRSILHGVPVMLKDNIDTVDMPTTGGSFVLAGSVPPDDAELVRRLREAGAIILAKVNLDDFATRGSGYSSIGGQTRNPHEPSYSPAGSSGGSGACAAAWFAPVTIGTDTGGSLRSPASVAGLSGLKGTRGLVSRDGLIPTCFSFDYAGPLARNVFDVAAALGAMAGYDKRDPDAAGAIGAFHRDYTRFLDRDALRGARVGVVRHGGGVDPEVDAVFDRAVADLRAQGAIIVDPVVYPIHVLGDWRTKIMGGVCESENVPYFDGYLSTLKAGYPRTLAELSRRGLASRAPREGRGAYPAVYERFEARAKGGAPLDSLSYRSLREHGVGMVRDGLLGVFEAHQLDAIVYATRPRPPHKIEIDEPFVGRVDKSHYETGSSGSGSGVNLRDISNVSGFPDLVVPAGWSVAGLPISISFLGPAFSEAKLLGYAYAYEQATHHSRVAKATPRLAGEVFEYQASPRPGNAQGRRPSLPRKDRSRQQ